MTKRYPLYTLVALFLTAMISSCNKDSDSFVAEGDFGNCSVTSFSLGKNDSVLKGLDSVYFSIDLVNAVIFNADSLPKGTRIDKMIVNIGTSSASACDLTFRIPETSCDTTISYIDSPNDSINFADGPVKLLVKSYDGLSSREYSIKLNVHEVVPDTLFWDKTARRTLPGTLSAPQAQKTVEFNGRIYCLTVAGDKASVASVENPYDNNWTAGEAHLPDDAVVESFAASNDAFYIIDGQGRLYTSPDALTWSATGAHMDYVYGGYVNRILGARKDSDGWKHVTYPATTEQPIPAGCPVGGTGQMVTYVTSWSSSPLSMFVGGHDASGNVVGSTWGYDGEVWAKISSRDIDEREDVALFPYFTPREVTGFWRVTERSALIALGGRYESTEGQVVSNNVYISYDQGITWDEASSYLQLPDYIPDFAAAQAMVVDARLDDSMSRSVSTADGWTAFTGNRMPVWATPVPFTHASRVSAPITEWECPYIYLFGGENAAGDLYNTLWKGVIRRFTFAPLY